MISTVVIGTAGAALILIGFILNQLDIWRKDTLMYDATNFIGGCVLIYYSFLLSSWPFLTLNTVWMLVSLRDVLKFFLKSKQ